MDENSNLRVKKYTTAQAQELEPEFNKSEFKAPMAGFGYGLPISRLVSFFGLDLLFSYKYSI